MDKSNAAASTLTRSRISLAIISAAIATTVGYFCYRVYNPALPEPAPEHRLRRSNAVRHRRRSLPELPHERRRPSDTSSASRDDSPSRSHSQSHGDDNVDLNTMRPLTDGETVAEEHVLEGEWHVQPRAGQNLVNLLFRVSEDNAKRNAYVHRGCQCNACGVIPIRGYRYRCANCADFDLCETCESQGLHLKTHVFYKVKVPVPRLAPRQIQPAWYPGNPQACLRNLPKSVMVKLSKETGFERPELEAFWEQWTFMANTEWREDPDDLCLAMDRKTFERYLGPSGGYRHTAPNLLHDRMFHFFDTNNDDLIGFSEFLHGVAYRKQKDRLRKVFEGYDVDGDGYVSRQDFLRLFRAYYVLYQQMHKDIVEGLDDQVMSSTDAHAVISSRQPLSSLFGREGPVPHADAGRPIEGKIYNMGTGDVLISDGRNRAVNEDKPDTTDRETILATLFAEDDSGDSWFAPPSEVLHQSNGQPDSRYWNTLLNPPARIEDLPAVLTGEPTGVRWEIEDGLFGPESESEEHEEDKESDSDKEGQPYVAVDNDGPSAGNGVGDGGGLDETLSPLQEQQGQAGSSGLNFSVPNVVQVEPSGRITVDGQTLQPLYPQTSSGTATARQQRALARRKLLERWKRRQFFLDEEEGANPPEGWKPDEHDVLRKLSGESSKSAQPPMMSPRSRSSSKVRFAEDTADDYEVRSNPSTSSRSVPERWGGMDIPDAERDAGKEILYQITQQGFNEILDVLFKSKEDAAIHAAETKAVRDKLRPFFENIDLEDQDNKTPGSIKNRQYVQLQFDITEEQFLDDIQQDKAKAQPSGAGEPIMSGGAGPAEEHGSESESEEDEDDNDDDDDDEPEQLVAGQSTQGEEGVYRDPTMPQFRPNSLSSSSSSSAAQKAAEEIVLFGVKKAEIEKGFEDEVEKQTEQQEQQPKKKTATFKLEPEPTAEEAGPSKNKTINTSKPFTLPVMHETLVFFKKLDVAEQEARERGGWGRLSFEEFEAIYKREEKSANRLDYLGTWIELCIAL